MDLPIVPLVLTTALKKKRKEKLKKATSCSFSKAFWSSLCLVLNSWFKLSHFLFICSSDDGFSPSKTNSSESTSGFSLNQNMHKGLTNAKVITI